MIIATAIISYKPIKPYPFIASMVLCKSTYIEKNFSSSLLCLIQGKKFIALEI